MGLVLDVVFLVGDNEYLSRLYNRTDHFVVVQGRCNKHGGKLEGGMKSRMQLKESGLSRLVKAMRDVAEASNVQACTVQESARQNGSRVNTNLETLLRRERSFREETLMTMAATAEDAAGEVGNAEEEAALFNYDAAAADGLAWKEKVWSD